MGHLQRQRRNHIPHRRIAKAGDSSCLRRGRERGRLARGSTRRAGDPRVAPTKTKNVDSTTGGEGLNDRTSRFLVAWLLGMTDTSRWAGKVGADAYWRKQIGVEARSFAALRMTH